MKTRLQRLAFLILFAGMAASSAQAQLLVDQNDVGCSDVTGTPYCTIQAAVNAASAGQTVGVAPATYIENVTINKKLTLFSTNGRAVTTIQGISGAGSLGAIVVTGGTSGVLIGGVGQGFTIVGIDNGVPGVENAAVYFQGSHSNAVVRDNEVVANGDHGLATEFGATISGFIIDDNEFSGQTFLGAPGGCGFGSQFTTPNVPRQLVVMGGGSGGGSTSNVTFTNNQVTGTAGGSSSIPPCTTFGQGNTLATIDTNVGTITGNTFAGTTARFATSLRTRGPSTTISGNTFDSSGLILPFTGHVFIQNIGVNLSTVAGANTFDKGVYVDGSVGTIGLKVGAFVAAVPGTFPAGSTINVLPGTYVESSQIHVTADLDLIGTNRTTTLIKPGFDTGSSGDPRGFFLVDNGVTFNLTEVTIDGTGRKVFQAIRTRGQGTISNVDFVEIKFNESGPHYSGIGMAVFGSGNVDVTNSTFTEMGRIGMLYFGAGITGSVFSGNTYTGKGAGDFLDYALDISAGAVVEVTDNTISGNRGVASVDGSTSAGILVTTFFASGTTSTITNNDIFDNTTGITVGFDASDASTVTATFNNITGNDTGINTTNPLVDGTCNWWGDADGPSGAGPGVGDPVDTGVTFNPWLLSPAPSTCFPLIARFEKQLARDGLAALLPTGDSENDKEIDKAIQGLDKSLNPGGWIDPNHLDDKKGNKVFDEEKKAVKHLNKVTAPLDVSAYIDALVLADKTLAQIAIDEVDCSAASNPKDEEKCLKEIDKAQDEIDKAQDEIDMGHFDLAIDKYKKAWETAKKALKKAGAAKGGEEALEAPVVAAEVPNAFSLEQNYPNPFNPTTTIRFDVPEAAKVKLVVYDMLGRRVRNLVDGVVSAGAHAAIFDARTLPSGAYIYRLETPQGTFTKTMLLVK